MSIIGIGNAITDIITPLQDYELLKELNFPKGSMQLVNIEKLKSIEKRLGKNKKKLSSGGSVANTIYGIGALGEKCSYIGKIGDDDIGRFFEYDMKRKNVNCYLSKSSSPSGQAIVFVTPDSERTFATFLGASAELTHNELKTEWFYGNTILHIEGYLTYNKPLIEKTAQLGKENNLLISFDLSSYNVVEDNRDFLRDFIKKYVDILFANEEESYSLTHNDIYYTINFFKDYCKYIIIKRGYLGSIIYFNNEITQIPALKVNVKDTTAAGDWYAAGFLYGLLKGLSIKKCGEIGTLLASKVIEHYGAKIPDQEIEELKNIINKKYLQF
ncbi:MAG: adenosine kinase [Bacteroidales bacterium]|nr:adenosine kinase [Bacteroidales bacterium]